MEPCKASPPRHDPIPSLPLCDAAAAINALPRILFLLRPNMTVSFSSSPTKTTPPAAAQVGHVSPTASARSSRTTPPSITAVPAQIARGTASNVPAGALRKVRLNAPFSLPSMLPNGISTLPMPNKPCRPLPFRPYDTNQAPFRCQLIDPHGQMRQRAGLVLLSRRCGL